MYSSAPSCSIKLALVKRYLSISNVHLLIIGYWSFNFINSLFSSPFMPIKVKPNSSNPPYRLLELTSSTSRKNSVVFTITRRKKSERYLFKTRIT